MKGVDTIARIRREFFVRGKTIKEIVRELHVSRNTVRKVLRSGATEFSYEREVQPLPKLGRWKADLDRLLAANEAKPARERLTLIRVFEELRASRLRGRLRRGPALCPELAARDGDIDGRRLCAAELCAGRGLPVRLEPRGRADQRHDGDREGRPRPALPQPDAVRAGLSARDAGDGLRRPRPGVRLLQGRLHARHLRQHEDGGGDDLRRQGAGLQSPLPADVRPLTWSIRSPARRPRAGRRGRSRTRSASCASASSRPGCG